MDGFNRGSAGIVGSAATAPVRRIGCRFIGAWQWPGPVLDCLHCRDAEQSRAASIVAVVVARFPPQAGPMWLHWMWTAALAALIAVPLTLLGFLSHARTLQVWLSPSNWALYYSKNLIIALFIGLSVHALLVLGGALVGRERVQRLPILQRALYYAALSSVGVADRLAAGLHPGGRLARAVCQCARRHRRRGVLLDPDRARSADVLVGAPARVGGGKARGRGAVAPAARADRTAFPVQHAGHRVEPDRARSAQGTTHAGIVRRIPARLAPDSGATTMRYRTRVAASHSVPGS